MEIKIDDAELNSSNLEFVLCVILHITRRRVHFTSKINR